MEKIKTISVSGVDGSGKSTMSLIIYKLVCKENVPVIRLWFRFPYFFTYILLFLARIIGLTKTFRYKSRVYSIHYFEKIRRPYKLLLVFDFTLNYIIRIISRKLIGVLLIFDREGIDTLVDYWTDTFDTMDNKSITYRLFMREHLVGNQFTIITDAPVKLLLKRRPELLRDPRSLLRIALYRILAKKLKQEKYNQTIILDTSLPLDNNIRTILRVVRETIKSFKPLGYGKKFRNPYLKAIFRNKYVILVTNWLIQGSLIASPIENLVRILIDFSIPAIVYLVSNNMWAAIAGFTLAHTLNYLVNSNAAHTRRFFTKYPNIDKKVNILLDYIRREIKQYKGVKEVIIFGSSIRGELGEHSDIDLRVAYRNGLKNIINAYLFITKLRIFSLKNNIPLDAFLVNESNMLRDLSTEEKEKYKPIVIRDQRR